MDALATRQLIRPVSRSALARQSEYLFWHALTRDVAYDELPRKVRAHKHTAAAGWFEAEAGERVEEFAEVLAHHYVTALDLARAAGESDLASQLEDPRCISLRWPATVPSTSTCAPPNGSTQPRWSCRPRMAPSTPAST